MRKFIVLSCLILMVGLAFGQESDEKLPLEEEPIITPREEIPTLPPQEPTKPPQEPEVERVQPPVTEGTPTISSGTQTTPWAGTLTVGTTTTEGTSTQEITPPQAGTSTAPGTITPPPFSLQLPEVRPPSAFSLQGTPTSSGTATPPPPHIGTITLPSTEGTAPSGTQTTPLTGTLTVGSATVGTTATIGTTATVGTPTLLNTGLILVPMAYRRDGKPGLNADFIIVRYLGELWHSMAGGEFFVPIKFMFLSTDFKYCLLKEKEKIPALGAGYEWFLVIQGQASTADQMGGQFSGKSDRFGYPYLMISKKFKNTGYHLGMMSGEMGKLLNPLSKYMQVSGKEAIVFGLDTKLFNRQINIEGIMPTGGKSHLLINTSIERFLGFDIGFMKTPDGFSVVGYFGIRMTIFPNIKGGK